jgi:hypothetical protein
MSFVNGILTCKNSEQKRRIFTIQPPTEADAKYRAPGKATGWGSRPRPSCSYQVSGAQNIHNSNAGKLLKSVLLVVLCFSNSSKLEKLIL